MPGTDGETQAQPGGTNRRMGMHLLFALGLGAWVAGVVAAAALANRPLTGAEALHWAMSRRLAWGYGGHPPLTAWCIRIWTELGGHTEMALRAGAAVLAGATLALVYALAWRITRRAGAAVLAAVLVAVSGWFLPGAAVIGPHALLLFCWALALLAFHGALHGNRLMWLPAGCALGLGLLSSPAMALLGVAFAACLLVHRRGVRRTPWPHAGVAVALLILAGPLWWEFRHGVPLLRGTLARNYASGLTFDERVLQVWEYAVGQVWHVFPLLFVLFAWGIAAMAERSRHSRDAALLFLASVVPLGFFGLLAFTRPVDAAWAWPAWLAAAPAFAWAWSEHAHGRRAWQALLVAVALAAVAAAGALRHEAPRGAGGPALGALIGRHSPGGAAEPFLLADDAELAALAEFYTPGQPRAQCMDAIGDGCGPYAFWEDWTLLHGRDAVFVSTLPPRAMRETIVWLTEVGACDRGEVLDSAPTGLPDGPETYCLARLRAFHGLEGAPGGPSGAPRAVIRGVSARARTLLESGAVEAAAGVYRAALAQYPDSRWLRADLASMLYAAGRLDAAATEAEALAARFPLARRFADKAGRWRAEAVETSAMTRSFALANTGDVDAAVEACREGLGALPGSRALHVRLVELLLEQEDYPAAAAACREALASQPHMARLHLLLGRALLGQGSIDEAISAFDQAAALAPANPAAQEALGRAFAAREEWEAAVRHLRHAVALHTSGDAPAALHRALAAALTHTGDSEGAREHRGSAQRKDGTMQGEDRSP